jgi:hypothetical protein
MPRIALIAALFLAAAAAACDLKLTAPNQIGTYGFVTFPTVRAANGSVSTAPFAQFFRGQVTTVPDSRFPIDTCVSGAFSEPGPLQNVTYLDAGPAIATTIGTRTDSLRSVTLTDTRYVAAGAGTIPVNPGDSIVVDIPGAAFPAGQLRGKAAETLNLDSVKVPTTTVGIPLKWNLPDDSNSLIILSLRYAPAGANDVLTQEIACSFVDDGADSVRARFATLWAASTNTRREMVALRLRTIVQSTSLSYLELISYFQATVALLP